MKFNCTSIPHQSRNKYFNASATIVNGLVSTLDVSGYATISYVDARINEELGNIGSMLDKIIGE